MYKTITNLPRTLTSIAVICSVYGCAATLPSHDGSLNTVYGINKTQPQQATTLAAEESVAPVEETYEPMVQTISNSGVIASRPIVTIESEDQTFNQSSSEGITETVVDRETLSNKEQLLDREHTLGPGETLFSVAGDLTGSSNNWEAIAEYNAISDPSEITVGQSVVIPGDLLIQPVSEEDLSSALKLVETIKSEQPESQNPNIVVSANGTQEIELAMLETTEESMEMPIVESSPIVARSRKPVVTKAPSDGSLTKSIANFASIIKTSFKLPTTKTNVKVSSSNTAAPVAIVNDVPETTEPLQTAMVTGEQLPAELNQPASMKAKALPIVEHQQNVEQELVKPAVLTEQNGQWIQVDGDFTPKAIYKGAGYTTGLLMRVSPGTKFKLTSKDGDWYEIETDSGAGYIFHRDVLASQ